MRILYIAENLDRPESHMIAGVARRGHEVTLLLPGECSTPSVVDSLVDRRTIRLNGRIDRQAIRAIRETVASRTIDLVHCLRSNRPVSNAVLALRAQPVPIVCYRGTLGNVSRWNPADWLTYLSPRVRRIVCVSNGVRRSLAQAGVKASRLVTIYKGHDPAWYRSETTPDLAEFGIPPDAFVVVCAANMRRLKGVDLLIESMRSVRIDRPVHLLLVGEVRDPDIQTMANEPGLREVVHLAGFREDAAALSGACHVCVMASRKREGLPRAVIEAMSQGVPAIVTDVGGMPELVVDGECGIVVPPHSAEALGEAISRMATDAEFHAACGKNALERILTTFGIGETIEKTLAMYEGCVRQA